MFDELTIKGKTIKEVHSKGDAIYFTTTDDCKYRMLHHQDCCETCYIVSGDTNINDLIGQTIIDVLEETETISPKNRYDYGGSRTTYKIITKKETFIIVWEGFSNGYYSETPTFEEIKRD